MMKNAKTSILSILPDKLICEILLFLDTNDVFLNFLLTSAKMSSMLQNSPYFKATKLAMLLKKTGFNSESSKKNLLSIRSDVSLLTAALSSVLLKINSGKDKEMPLIGYESDGGMFGDQEQYWISSGFTKNVSFCCSKIGRNFNLKAAIKKTLNENHISPEISEDIKREIMNEFILSNTFTANNPPSESLMLRLSRGHYPGFVKDLIKRDQSTNFCINKKYFERALEKLKIKYNSEESEIIKILEATDAYLNKTKLKVKPNTNDYLLRDESFILDEKKIMVLKSVELCRKSSCTCPVKSCAGFVSDIDSDIENDAFLKKFEFLENPSIFSDFYQREKSNLPKIYKTNVYDLKKEAGIFDNSYNGYFYAVFKNYGLDHYIRPMFWISFYSLDTRIAKIDFEKNLFSGSITVCKLINCDVTDDHDRESETNIDFDYFSFRGEIISEN